MTYSLLTSLELFLATTGTPPSSALSGRSVVRDTCMGIPSVDKEKAESLLGDLPIHMVSVPLHI